MIKSSIAVTFFPFHISTFNTCCGGCSHEINPRQTHYCVWFQFTPYCALTPQATVTREKVPDVGRYLQADLTEELVHF